MKTSLKTFITDGVKVLSTPQTNQLVGGEKINVDSFEAILVPTLTALIGVDDLCGDFVTVSDYSQG